MRGRSSVIASPLHEVVRDIKCGWIWCSVFKVYDNDSMVVGGTLLGVSEPQEVAILRIVVSKDSRADSVVLFPILQPCDIRMPLSVEARKIDIFLDSPPRMIFVKISNGSRFRCQKVQDLSGGRKPVSHITTNSQYVMVIPLLSRDYLNIHTMKFPHSSGDPSTGLRVSEIGRGECGRIEELLDTTIAKGAKNTWAYGVDGGQHMECAEFMRARDE